jgi:ABC-type transport system involved in multi-copper enzyme maturation permease subunit
VYNFPLDIARTGISLHRRPDILSILISGVEGDAARRGTVNLYTFPTYDVSIYNTTPILAMFGILDLAFVVKILLSLFAILFTYDAVSGEKETGGLRMIFSNSVDRSSFILAKFITSSLQLLIPFAIPFLLGLLIISFFPAIEFGTEEMIRIGLIFLTFVLYLLTFAALGIAVSSLTQRSVVSFLLLLMLWVLFNGIVPRLSVWTAQNLEPVPPADEVKKVYFIEYGEQQEAFARQMNEILKPYLDNPLLLVTSRDRLLKKMSEEYEDFTLKMQKRGQELSREQDLKQEQQNRLAIAIARYTSPAAALTFSVNRLGRTGVYSSDRVFRNAVEGYKKTYDDYVRQQIREDPSVIQGGTGTGDLRRDESDLYPGVERFDEESLAVSSSAALVDMAVIALYGLIFFAIGFTAFLRYDVR